jgi:hypothetical protein
MHALAIHTKWSPADPDNCPNCKSTKIAGSFFNRWLFHDDLDLK